MVFFGHFSLFNWAWSKLSLATVTIGSLNFQDMISFMITTGSLNNQDMISPINNYVMDIIYMLCEVYLSRSKFNKES